MFVQPAAVVFHHAARAAIFLTFARHSTRCGPITVWHLLSRSVANV